jgi:hypothetical protein
VTKHLLILAVWLLCIGRASASIVSTTGDVAQVPAPPSVDNDVYESDTHISLFVERQSLRLSSAVTVDISQPGTVTDSPDFSRTDLAAGTWVDSYYLHFDPVGSPAPSFVSLTGFVTFDQPILGIIITNTYLNACDAILGAPGTIYPTGGPVSPGLDLNQDVLTLTADRHSLWISLSARRGIDALRVVTAAVPEPATASLLIIAAAFLPRRPR